MLNHEAAYDQYIQLLQERNRLVKDLRHKDDTQIALEKKEQGFSLYVNGANSENPKKKHRITPLTKTPRRAPPTKLPLDDLRSKSAPSSRRKGWTTSRLQVKTNDGTDIFYDPPRTVTGNYSEDFHSSDDDATYSEGGERVMLSCSEIGMLHESLCTQLRHQPLEEDTVDSDSDLSLAADSSGSSASELLRPDDTIVFEFQPKPSRNRQVCSAVQRKTDLLDDDRPARVSASEPAVKRSKNRRPMSAGLQSPTEVQKNELITALKHENARLSRELSSERGNPVEKLVDHVLRMSVDQQQKMLTTLGSLHKSVSQTSQQSRSDTAHGVAESSSADNFFGDSIVASSMVYHPELADSDAAITRTTNSVTFRLLSNWSGNDKIGLTEVQFTTSDGTQLGVDEVRCTAGGELQNLRNGRSKTNKTSNMWTCQWDHRPIELIFDFSPQHSFKEVATITVWNYNKSLSALGVGVREVEIYRGAELVYAGHLEKGCGNQVFDYGQLIDFRPDSEKRAASAAAPVTNYSDLTTGPVERSNTMVISSPDPEQERPMINHHEERSERASSSGKPPSPMRPAATSLKPKPPGAAKARKPEDNNSKDRAKGPPAPLVANSIDDDDFSMLQQIKQLKRNMSSEELKSSDALLKMSDSPTTPRRPSWLAEDVTKMSTSALLDEPAAPKPAKSRNEDPLEMSWASLDMFNKHNRNRLSLDTEGDSLDQYIQAIQQKPSQPAIPEEGEGPAESELRISLEEDLDDSFVIPELPAGRKLSINIRSTWGDRFYLGLNGIEVYTDGGELAEISDITADPLDINILPEYGSDPRVVSNLLDGVNRTRDDTHMWMTPFTRGQPHLLHLTFARPSRVALIRIWNYNKSRIHSYRGAREIEISLDEQLIFKGEIERASGGVLGGTETFGETILFTTDDEILSAVSKYDSSFIAAEDSSDDDEFFQRPLTADEETGDTARPLTRASIAMAHQEVPVEPVLFSSEGKLLLTFTSTWGDQHYLGLTGLEVLDLDGDPLSLNISQLSAQPPDVRSLPGHAGDCRTIDKLIDGVTVTTDDDHMWLIPYNENSNQSLTIEVGDQPISGLQLWNYNKSSEDTARGVRTMDVSLDGRKLSPPGGFLCRRAPGACYFDFAQRLMFGVSLPPVPVEECCLGDEGLADRTQDTEADGDYEVNGELPRGFVYQLQLLSSHGDQYYLGLNGIQLFDDSFRRIALTDDNIAAHPDSVNVLKPPHPDSRTPDKLIDTVNDTMDPQHMWLAPMLPGVVNRVFLIFDQPVTVSMIRLWNYGKTAKRGVKDFAVLVDDLLIYTGTLPAVQAGARGILPTVQGNQPHHTVLFSNDVRLVQKEKHATIKSNENRCSQDVQLTNNNKVICKVQRPTADQALRPMTSVPKKRR